MDVEEVKRNLKFGDVLVDEDGETDMFIGWATYDTLGTHGWMCLSFWPAPSWREVPVVMAKITSLIEPTRYWPEDKP